MYSLCLKEDGVSCVMQVMMMVVMICECWCWWRHTSCHSSDTNISASSCTSGGRCKATSYRHLLLIVGIVIVVAAVAAVINVRAAAATAASIEVRAAAAAIAWRCCARVKITDAVISIGALIIMSMARSACSELLLQLVVGLGLAIVVVVVIILRIPCHRLRLHSRIILDCRRRFPLATVVIRAPQMLYLRVIDKLRLRGGQLRSGFISQLAISIAITGQIGLIVDYGLIGGQL